MSQISILYRLQQIDSQLDNTRLSLQNIEKDLNDSSPLLSSQEKLTRSEQAHQTVLKVLHECENKSHDIRVKIELSEASLYGGKIHNPKELQDLQNEIASLKRLTITLEDNELTAMMAVEETESELAKTKQEFAEIQARQVERQAILKGERTKLVGQIDRLDAERKATLAPISESDLALYEQLRKIRNGVAVVKISSRACTACGTTLTPALIQSSQSTGQLVRCPTCGRILYPG